MVFVKSNLPVGAQPWGRQVEKAITTLETTTATERVNNAARDAQANLNIKRLDSSLQTVAKTASDLQTLINNIYVPGTETIDGDALAEATITGSKVVDGSLPGGKIQANSITANQISTNYIYAGQINAGQINAGTLTGFTINTASSPNTRVSMSGTEISFYNSSYGSGTTRTGFVWGPAGGGVYVGTAGAASLWLSTGTIEINVDGGTAFFANSSSATIGKSLSVTGSITSSAGITASTGSITASNGNISAGGSISSGTGAFINGNASIGGTLTRTALASGGTTYAYINNNGDFYRGAAAPSDRRLKENISTTSLGLDFIKSVDPVEFEFLNKTNPHNQGVQFGVIAQDLAAALEEHGISGDNGLVYIPNIPEEEGGSDGYYLVNHEQLISPIIKAIQDLSSIVETLNDRIEVLEGK